METTELERRLKVADLSKYQSEKYNDMEKFALGVLRYRKFKTKAGLKNLKELWENKFTELTATFYFDSIVKYCENGGTMLSTRIKSFIDRHKDGCAIISPDAEDVRASRSRKNKKEVKHVTNALKAVQSQQLTEKFNYGIRFNGCCMMSFESEQAQEWFLKGLEMGKVIKDFVKIHIKSDAIEEVKE